MKLMLFYNNYIKKKNDRQTDRQKITLETRDMKNY